MRLPHADSHLAELLTDRALFGLDDSAAAELRSLLQQHPEVDDWALDRAAASLFAGLQGMAQEAPPASVRATLERAAADWTGGTRRDDLEPIRIEGARGRVGSTGQGGARLAWVAAAAGLLLAMIAWWPRVAQRGESAQDLVSALAGRPDVVRLAWAPGPDETGLGASGEVVWSDEAQQGYMEFRGLPALDRSRWQYQLWIVDPERDARPVDGGVFDIPESGEGLVRVPIDAKLRVDHPAAFVVTVEQPGGVVVSSQERVALIAAAGS